MSWKKVKLGTVLTESKIICKNPNPDRRIKVKLKVLGVEKRGLENEIEGATKQFIRKAGQFIYGRQNFHKGAFGIVPNELDGFESSADLPAFDVNENCLPEWIFYFFKQGNYYLELTKIARGVATQRIHPEQIYDLEIPLPDIEIQKQFLLKIKSIENNGAEISTELTHQQDLVKQLRQSFLREAMQGKLVKSEKLKVKSEETGKQLLERIKKEKQELIKQGKLKKGKELQSIKEEKIPFDVPENWVWCRLGEILTEIKYGTSQSCDYNSTKNAKVLRIPNVSGGLLNGEDLKYTNLSLKERTELALHEKDILIIRSNGSRELVGKTVLVTSEFTGYSYAGYLVRWRFNKELTNPNFLWFATTSPFFRESIETPLRTTVGINNINTDEMANLLIPLPPLPVQHLIVKKLEQLMQLCDELKQSIQQSKIENEKLLQGALRDALRN